MPFCSPNPLILFTMETPCRECLWRLQRNAAAYLADVEFPIVSTARNRTLPLIISS